MPAAELSALHFHNEETAYRVVEAALWPDGPICPHCGTVGRAYSIKGARTRIGLRKCAACRKQFAVKVGTIFEDSHVPLHKWLQAFHLMCASKKGVSCHQLHRMLGISLKTAWFLGHRLRAAMEGAADDPGGLGGLGKIVEADETYFGPKDDAAAEASKPGPAGKRAIVGLVERGGKARTFHVATANSETVRTLLRTNASRKSKLMTDESRLYTEVGAEYARHGTVNHSAGEYVGFDDPEKHTNTIEGYFGLFKRGMKGIYQHCDEAHLARYLAEFEFRYNARVRLGVDDSERAEMALKGVVGKRLTYRQPDKTVNP